MSVRLLPALVSALAVWAWSAAAGQADEPDPASALLDVLLPDTKVHRVSSDRLERAYDIFVKLPPGYGDDDNRDRRYPVIYFNDAPYCWVTGVGVTRVPFGHGGYEQAILVGISYAIGEGAVPSRRRDLTPSEGRLKGDETGGAPEYLGYLKNELIPFVEATYRADPDRRMLVGQSLGGVFGAYALLTEPGLFSDYVLTSPSLWVGERSIFDLEADAHERGVELTGRVYFAIGEYESPAGMRGWKTDMVGQQGEFAEVLRSRGHDQLVVWDEVVEGATHTTTYPIALTNALRMLLPGPEITEDLKH